MVGNCLTLKRLGPSRKRVSDQKGDSGSVPQLTPKLVWVPVNPLVAPPWELAPNFTEWHTRWLDSRSDDVETVGNDDESAWWFAQCSLASATSIMGDQGYVLLHVEHSFAVFILKGLWPAV